MSSNFDTPKNAEPFEMSSNLVRNEFEMSSNFDTPKNAEPFEMSSHIRITDKPVTEETTSLMGGASANAEDPTPTKRRTRKTRLPDNWQPNPEHHATAHRLHLNLDSEAEDFRNHAQAQGRRLVDWDAGFRSWLKKSAEYAQERQGAYRNQAATTSERVQGWIELGQQFAQNPRKEIRA